ncbi:MAG: hypothetical protein FJ320_05125 [SAR202 cluster bacterium]|nr:hypothetical protein [SAR202 cluster bacterium]
MKKLILVLTLVGAMVALFAVPVSAHVHVVSNPHHSQQLANGQNHPGFVGNVSCEGIAEPANAGPAGYGLETAHHGPDSGDPGKDDGCYERDAPPDDQNPAID